MDIFTVAFFGHKHIEEPDKLKKCLDYQIRRLMDKKDYVRFLVAWEGDFDQMASSAVCRVRRRHRPRNSELVYMIPNVAAEDTLNADNLASYCEIEVCQEASSKRIKDTIRVRNQEMIKRADLVLCYVTHQSNGAWKSVQHAIQQGKMVINLAEMIECEGANCNKACSKGKASQRTP